MLSSIVAALAALLAATSAGAATVPAPAEPAMFVVGDSDTTVYIFGTLHALDRRTQWFDDKLRNAFEQSRELVLETLIPESPDEYAETPGFRPPSATPSASFLATARMAIKVGRAQGMNVNNGADLILRHAAESEGKSVQGLETLQFQIDMFSRMPSAVAPSAATPRAFSPVGASQMQSLSQTMIDMQSAWKSGDQRVFARMLYQLKSEAPDTYRIMFTDRNDRWADWIRGRMRTPGIVFVAVGAGHLAGPDSLLVRLAQRGITSRRVQ